MTALSFRDCEAWRADGLPLSTSSNEACKMYDAILTQYVKWRNDETLGGIEGCVSAMQAADPNFGSHRRENKAFVSQFLDYGPCDQHRAGLELAATTSSTRLNERLASTVRKTVQLANSQDISPREQLHVKAIELFSHGNFPKACNIWEDILVDHPTDLLALKFAHDAYFYMGAQNQIRDSVARVLPYWKPHMPLSSYLKGLYSFGLLETRFYDQAEKVAMEGLAVTPDDAWCVHSVAHVLEMTAEVDKGLKFLESREKDWQVSDVLASHNYWHWALYFIEKGQYDAALQIYDSQVFRRCKASGSMLDTVDACSMLYRLEMEGVCVKDRWRELLQITQPHTDDHVTLFNDLHFLMVSLGAKDGGTSRRLLEGLKELAKQVPHHLPSSLHTSTLCQPYVRAARALCKSETETRLSVGRRDGERMQSEGGFRAVVQQEPGDNLQLHMAETIGVPMCQAMMEYDQGNYSRAVELLYPLRYRVVRVGGSDAQV
ncbi:hypothetical protein L3Q82_024137, partial [Scortum barcoo]